MTRPRRTFSVRAAVLLAATAVALMTVVAGAASWVVYARIEAFLVTVADAQSRAMAQALRLAETSNRYAAGAGEIDAARNHLQRQNATVALAQHAQALQEALSTLRRLPRPVASLDTIADLVGELERNLAAQNMLVERRIDLDAQARRNRTELARIQSAFDQWLRGRDPELDRDARYAAESAVARLMFRLTDAGQIEQASGLTAARTDYAESLARFGTALAGLSDGASDAVRRLLDAVERLADGDRGVFAIRAATLTTRTDLDRQAASTREVVTLLGIAVARLVSTMEAETDNTRQAVAAHIDTGRTWLLLIAAFTFLGPVVLVWVAVRRAIAVPLSRLAQATRRIADGDLHAPVPATRFREFQDIGDALAVFRDNTAALSDRSAALLRSEEAHRQARRQAEAALAELRETQEQLVQAEKMSALASLVAGVAHEINTPIGITVTAVTLLQEELEAMRVAVTAGTLKRSDFQQFVERAVETARLIHGNMQRAADLVHAFKQVAADQSNDRPRPFDLREILEQTLVSVGPACQKAGHTTALDCPALIVMEGFPGAVSQVVTILIINALDHAFAPGQHGRITVSGRVDGATATVEVADDGCGIPADRQRRIFEPFFTTRRNQGNTGLGLHIAFNIVQQTLKGRIELLPGSGGARFAVRIPLAHAEIAAAGGTLNAPA